MELVLSLLNKTPPTTVPFCYPYSTVNHVGPQKVGEICDGVLLTDEKSSSVVSIYLSIQLGGTGHTHWLPVQHEVSPEMVKASIWRFLFSSSFGLVLQSLIFLIYPCCKFIYATDTLLPGQFLNEKQSLVSKNGAFKLGLDCSIPRDDISFCGLGIWFANSSSRNYDYIPVWVPNQVCINCYSSYNISVSEEGVIYINSTDEDYNYHSHMSTPPPISVVAVLLDSGNLVIRDQVNNSMVIWQSFDSPTNVLLPGGYLGFNPTRGENVSLSSYSSAVSKWPSYTLSLDATRRRGFIIQENSDGPTFAGTFPRWMDIHEDEDYALTFNDVDTYLYLGTSGYITLVKKGERDSVLWSAPESICDFDSYCGPYGLCKNWSSSCTCPTGFAPNPQLPRGCSSNELLDCHSGFFARQEVTLYSIEGIYRFPENSISSKARSMEECKAACLRDCTCTAFAYNASCLLWFQELRNTVLFDSVSNGSRLYVRLAMRQQNLEEVIVLSALGALALIVIVLIVLCKCRRKLMKARTVNDNGSLTVFSFAQIKNSTKNFSEKLGEGGFGFVFKGTMPVSTIVAVKKLKCLGQGDKQFRTEVQTIGMIQHTNLVRLLGFCADGSKRLLVYEYMINGSLNSHLFCRRSAKLSWEMRYSVALGIARGLAYLHEECKDCIVHCDIKPDNILLDEQFCPKIADFGLAKLLGRDFSRVLTTMRGTIGYLAPEWISGVPITNKADVYSYGMMLLEIISGRRNSEKIREGKFTYFPIYAAVKLIEGDVMCLLDSSLEGNADAEQLNRACRVACWCIQDVDDHRPMMGQVVRMLEGVIDVEVPPIPRSLQNYVGMEDSYSEKVSEISFWVQRELCLLLFF